MAGCQPSAHAGCLRHIGRAGSVASALNFVGRLQGRRGSHLAKCGAHWTFDAGSAPGLSGPMLNDYSFGGYLIWAAPEYPVMMDGRTDVYEWSGFLGEFGNWATLQSDPNALLQKYRI